MAKAKKREYGLTAAEGKRTDKGTLITRKIIEAAKADYEGNLVVLADNTEQINQAIDKAIANALEKIGQAAERFAKSETPVDTGRLRNSITHVLDIPNGDVYVGSNVEYAEAVELGYRRKKGPALMLTHAAENHGDYYRSILKSAMENA